MWQCMVSCGKPVLFPWEVVPSELNQVSLLHNKCEVCHVPNESTSSPNAVFLYDLCHRVCESHLSYNGCKWSKQFCGILSCLSRHPNLLCEWSRQFSRKSPILHQLYLVFLHLTCFSHIFSSCLEWNPLLHTFSPICVSCCPVWTWHTRKLSKFTFTHPVESVFVVYVIKKKNKGWSSAVCISTRYKLGVSGFEPQWGKLFCTCPYQPSGPPSLLYSGYWV